MKFWIDVFFNSLATDLSQPHFERLSLLGWNRLNDAEDLLGRRNVGKTVLTV